MSPSPKPPLHLTLEALQLAFIWGCEARQQSQLVSLDLCNACREAIPLRLTVTDHMPPSLSFMFFGYSPASRRQYFAHTVINGESVGNQKGNVVASAFPFSADQPSGELPRRVGATILDEEESGKHRRRLASHGRVSHVVWAASGVSIRDVVSWPHGVLHLSFLEPFDEDLGPLVWPAGLRELTIREGFNRPIEGIGFPGGLEKMSFGADFDQPVELAAFPPALTFLSLGASFNHPIAGAKWPDCLKKIVWGNLFNQPVEKVRWPQALESIAFGNAFNHPIEQATFPTGLRSLLLGTTFDHPVEGVSWPTAIDTLSFGYQFNHPVAGMSWPAGLKEVGSSLEKSRILLKHRKLSRCNVQDAN